MRSSQCWAARGHATHLPTDGNKKPGPPSQNAARAYGATKTDISVFFMPNEITLRRALIALRPVNDIYGVVRVSPE
jgi:hypothetical protein